MAPARMHEPTEADIAKRKIVGINEETVTNTTSTDFPGHYLGEDHAWDLEEFENNLRIDFHKNERLDASFSVVGIDASVANAFRRIMLAEIATFSIEVVQIFNNTSIIQDEVLSARLGLIPLSGNPDGFERMGWWTADPARPEAKDKDKNSHDTDTLVFHLIAKCTRNKDAAEDEDDPRKLYHNAHIYAKDLVWAPYGNQKEWFKDDPPRAENPDILIAKLRPGQELDIKCIARKGNGADHAKFSPVATATYRLLPLITITKPIIGDDAKKFQKCFLPGVINIDTVTDDDAVKDKAYRSHIGQQKAVVKNAFKDSVSRECLRHEEFKGKVKLGRVQDHFIFSVESTGQHRSDEIFLASVQHLRAKILALRADLDTINRAG